MMRHRVKRVSRARRVIAAHLAVERADREPIATQKSDQDPLHDRRPLRTAARSSSKLASAAGGNARTTISAPRGSSESSAATMCRSRRFTRLRTTAEPTAFDTTNPARGGEELSASTTWTTKVAEPERRPVRTVRRNWSAVVRRCAALSTERQSDGDALAALAATSRQDGSASTGPHPETETVHLVPTTVVRLVRTLAHRSLHSCRDDVDDRLERR